MPGKGEIEIEILPNGDLKIETGDMAGAAHKSADEFLADVLALMGGNEERVSLNKHKHGHHHHDHEHDHHHH